MVPVDGGGTCHRNRRFIWLIRHDGSEAPMRTKVAFLAGTFALFSAAVHASQQQPPSYLSPAAQAAFSSYLASPVGKAFAVEPNGGFGWAAGYERTDAAR